MAFSTYDMFVFSLFNNIFLLEATKQDYIAYSRSKNIGTDAQSSHLQSRQGWCKTTSPVPSRLGIKNIDVVITATQHFLKSHSWHIEFICTFTLILSWLHEPCMRGRVIHHACGCAHEYSDAGRYWVPEEMYFLKWEVFKNINIYRTKKIGSLTVKKWK